MQADKPGLESKEPRGGFNHALPKTIVLHNAQIDKTVMIHDWLHSTTTYSTLVGHWHLKSGA
jgi:hypothetical protein